MYYGQEIALFTGTLRFNLDPKGMFTDDKIWSCVTSFGLLEFVQGLGRRQLMGPEGATAASDSCGSAGLDTDVRPGGSSLSNGEKQLICCLRGLLCKFQYLYKRPFPSEPMRVVFCKSKQFTLHVIALLVKNVCVIEFLPN